MRVCVVGCGAIGGLFAAHLGRLDDVEVWAYDTSAEHVEAIERDGLRLTGGADLTARVRATTDPGAIPPCELGIVATKARFTEAAIAAAAPALAGAAVCSVQNGIGNEELIAERVPRVMRGVTMIAGRVEAPGVIHMDAPGDTWIGPFEPKPATSDEVQALAGAIARGGMSAHALGDARPAQWTKLIFNASTNPICALTGLTHGEICELDELRPLIGGLVAEGRAVAEALGVSLEGDPEEVIYRAGRENFLHRPSMLQDVLAQRPTEIEALNGGIVRAGREVAVPTPLHEAISALIAGLERSW